MITQMQINSLLASYFQCFLVILSLMVYDKVVFRVSLLNFSKLCWDVMAGILIYK